MGYRASTKKTTTQSDHKRVCLTAHFYQVKAIKEGEVRFCPHGKIQGRRHEYMWMDLHPWQHPIQYIKAIKALDAVGRLVEAMEKEEEENDGS